MIPPWFPLVEALVFGGVVLAYAKWIARRFDREHPNLIRSNLSGYGSRSLMETSMRLLHDDLHPAYTAAMMADLTSTAPATSTHAGSGQARAARDLSLGLRQEPAGADFGLGGGRGGGEGVDGAVWAPERVPSRLAHTVRLMEAGIDVGRLNSARRTLAMDADVLTACVEDVYAAARRVLSEAGPMPLAALEPWVEGDEAYRERLGAVAYLTAPRMNELFDVYLDRVGEEVGLPRARLVPTEPRP